MQLPGRLSASTLGDLLGALHRERTTGRLELTEVRGPRGLGVPGRTHLVHLASGLVTAVETGLPVPPLGEILRREGWVDAGALVRALARLEQGDPRTTGELLVDEGLARAEAVRAGLAKQLRARIEALFGIEEASIAFRTARPLRGAGWGIRPLSPGEFLHGRPRRRDVRKAGGAEAEGEPPRSGVRAARVDDARGEARALLGLGEEAGPLEVRRAFRRLAGELHPDRWVGAPEEERRRKAARFARISAAYHLLVA